MTNGCTPDRREAMTGSLPFKGLSSAAVVKTMIQSPACSLPNPSSTSWRLWKCSLSRSLPAPLVSVIVHPLLVTSDQLAGQRLRPARQPLRRKPASQTRWCPLCTRWSRRASRASRNQRQSEPTLECNPWIDRRDCKDGRRLCDTDENRIHAGRQVCARADAARSAAKPIVLAGNERRADSDVARLLDSNRLTADAALSAMP